MPVLLNVASFLEICSLWHCCNSKPLRRAAHSHWNKWHKQKEIYHKKRIQWDWTLEHKAELLCLICDAWRPYRVFLGVGWKRMNYLQIPLMSASKHQHLTPPTCGCSPWRMLTSVVQASWMQGTTAVAPTVLGWQKWKAGRRGWSKSQTIEMQNLPSVGKHLSHQSHISVIQSMIFNGSSLHCVEVFSRWYSCIPDRRGRKSPVALEHNKEIFYNRFHFTALLLYSIWEPQVSVASNSLQGPPWNH